MKKRQIVFNGLLIYCFLLGCCPNSKNTSTNLHMKEIDLKNAMLQTIVPGKAVASVYYQLSFDTDKNWKGSVIYFKSLYGVVGEKEGHSYRVILDKPSTELPRSIYPILSQGKILIMKKILGFEKYQIIKNFVMLDQEEKQ